jgi:hypothetical protein
MVKVESSLKGRLVTDYYKIVMNLQPGLFDSRFARTDENPAQTAA